MMSRLLLLYEKVEIITLIFLDGLNDLNIYVE